VTSILPGELVQCLITSISSLGLNVQVLGYFDGTIDEYHLPPGEPADNFKAGKKVKARVLYEIPGTSPPRFALSLASHIISLERKSIGVGDDEEATNIGEAYPVGTTLDAVKIVRVEAERGLLVDVQEDVQGFVHVSIFIYPAWHYLKPPRFLTHPMNTSLRYPLFREHGKLGPPIVLGSLGTTLLMVSFNCLCAPRS
jgi:ribosomal protein S1